MCVVTAIVIRGLIALCVYDFLIWNLCFDASVCSGGRYQQFVFDTGSAVTVLCGCAIENSVLLYN
jgi:hypothetical protein